MSNQSEFGWVRDAIYSKINSELAKYRDKIAWKNIRFNSDKHDVYIKLVFVPVTEEIVTLGDHGENESEGFIQIGVYQRIGMGTEQSEAIVNDFKKIFKIGSRIDCPPGCTLKIKSRMLGQGGQTSQADMAAGGREDVRDAMYLTVFWLAREPR